MDNIQNQIFRSVTAILQLHNTSDRPLNKSVALTFSERLFKSVSGAPPRIITQTQIHSAKVALCTNNPQSQQFQALYDSLKLKNTRGIDSLLLLLEKLRDDEQFRRVQLSLMANHAAVSLSLRSTNQIAAPPQPISSVDSMAMQQHSATNRSSIINVQSSTPSKKKFVSLFRGSESGPSLRSSRSLLLLDFDFPTLAANPPSPAASITDSTTSLATLSFNQQQNLLLLDLFALLKGCSGRFITPILTSKDVSSDSFSSLASTTLSVASLHSLQFSFNCDFNSSLTDAARPILSLCSDRSLIASFVDSANENASCGLVIQGFAQSLAALLRELQIATCQLQHAHEQAGSSSSSSTSTSSSSPAATPKFNILIFAFSLRHFSQRFDELAKFLFSLPLTAPPQPSDMMIKTASSSSRKASSKPAALSMGGAAGGAQPGPIGLAQRCPRGAPLLSALHDARNSAIDLAIRAMWTRCACEATAPLLATVSKWIYRGVLHDPHNEFFVVEDAQSSKSWQALITKTSMASPDYWNLYFRLDRARIPNFFAPYADKILETGKYLNVIRQCIPSSSSSATSSAGGFTATANQQTTATDELADAFPALQQIRYASGGEEASNKTANQKNDEKENTGDDDYATAIKQIAANATISSSKRGATTIGGGGGGEAASYSAQFEAAYAFASQLFFRLVFQERFVRVSVCRMKRIFLMESADVFYQFMEVAHTLLFKRKSDVSKSKLNTMLHAALRSNDSFKHDPEIDKIRVMLADTDLITQLIRVTSHSGSIGGAAGANLSAGSASLSSLLGDSGGAHLPAADHLTVLEALSLEFEVAWPLSLLFNKLAMQRYQSLFRRLFYCKFVERLLLEVSRLIQSNKRFTRQSNNNSSGSASKRSGAINNSSTRSSGGVELLSLPNYGRAAALCQRMLLFVQTLQNYMFNDVIDVLWRSFFAQLTSVAAGATLSTVNQTNVHAHTNAFAHNNSIASSSGGLGQSRLGLNDMIEAHQHMLNHMLEQCLLLDSSLLRIFQRTTSLCVMFAERAKYLLSGGGSALQHGSVNTSNQSQQLLNLSSPNTNFKTSSTLNEKIMQEDMSMAFSSQEVEHFVRDSADKFDQHVHDLILTISTNSTEKMRQLAFRLNFNRYYQTTPRFLAGESAT